MTAPSQTIQRLSQVARQLESSFLGKSEAVRLMLIAAIAGAVDVPVQTGGGVRGGDDVRVRLDHGASRVVVGHTTQDAPYVTVRFAERVFLIDTGAGDKLDAVLEETGGVAPVAVVPAAALLAACARRLIMGWLLIRSFRRRHFRYAHAPT